MARAGGVDQTCLLAAIGGEQKIMASAGIKGKRPAASDLCGGGPVEPGTGLCLAIATRAFSFRYRHLRANTAGRNGQSLIPLHRPLTAQIGLLDDLVRRKLGLARPGEIIIPTLSR